MTLPPGRKPLTNEWFTKFARMSPSLANGWYFPNVTRVEVIDNVKGRRYAQWDIQELEAVFQDDGHTLKLFVQYTPEDEISDD